MGTVVGHPNSVKRLSKVTRTCNAVTCRSNIRTITRSPNRLKQCTLVSAQQSHFEQGCRPTFGGGLFICCENAHIEI